MFRCDVADHGGLAVIVSFRFDAQRLPDKGIRTIGADQQGGFDLVVTIFTGEFNGGGIIIDANPCKRRRTDEIEALMAG